MGVSILDPSKLDLNILGCKVEGFSSGSFVTVVRESPTFQVTGSMKGTKLATRNRHANYNFTFRLDNTANANTWLHAIYKLQEAYGVVFPVPVVYKDRMGNTSFFCTTGIIEEPQVEQGDGVNPTEWRIICPKVMNTIGGNGKDEAVAKVLQTITEMLSLVDYIGIDLTGLTEQAKGIMARSRDLVGGLF